MGVMPVRDSASGMAQDLDRGFGDVLVVVRRTRLAEVFQNPRLRTPDLGGIWLIPVSVLGGADQGVRKG